MGTERREGRKSKEGREGCKKTMGLKRDTLQSVHRTSILYKTETFID